MLAGFSKEASTKLVWPWNSQVKHENNDDWCGLQWSRLSESVVKWPRVKDENSYDLLWKSENWYDLQWKRVRIGMTYSERERENWCDLQWKSVRTGMPYSKREWKQWHGSEPFTKDNSWKTTTKSQDTGAVPFSGVEAATPPFSEIFLNYSVNWSPPLK